MTGQLVAFDAHHIGSGQGGNETYCRETLRAWLGKTPSLLPLVPAGTRRSFVTATGWSGPVAQTLGDPLSRWTYALGRAAKAHSAALLHTTYFAPLVRPRKFVVTIHDTSFRRFPEWFAPGRAKAMSVTVRRAAGCADVIIAISAAMAQDLADVYPFAASRIRVVPLGAPCIALGPAVSAAPGAGRSPASDPYILYVGNINARKNLRRLIEAFAIATKRRRSTSLRLKIVGRGDTREVVATAERQRVSASVDLVGGVSDDELAQLYAGAHAVAYVSLYEGFGLPVAEALAYGKPVVASDIPAHREVARGCAILADPHDSEAIAAGIEAALDGPPVNSVGIARARQLSWAASTARLADVYQEVLSA